jgi:dGTP triphosphohydrolase
VEGKTGGFYGNERELKVKQKLVSTESQQKIWNYCVEATKNFIKKDLSHSPQAQARATMHNTQ